MREICITSTTSLGDIKYKFEYYDGKKTFYHVESDSYYVLSYEVEKLVHAGYINVYDAFDNYFDDHHEALIKRFISDYTEEK